MIFFKKFGFTPFALPREGRRLLTPRLVREYQLGPSVGMVC